MKTSIIFALIAFFSINEFALSGGFKPGSEPEGFRGIEWGTDISKRSVFNPTPSMVKQLTSLPNIDMCYTREDESMHWGAAQLDRVIYNCRYGKLYKVSILVSDYNNWLCLKGELFKIFGPAANRFEGGTSYPSPEIAIWKGPITRIALIYNYQKNFGILEIFSTEEILEQPKTNWGKLKSE